MRRLLALAVLSSLALPRVHAEEAPALSPLATLSKHIDAGAVAFMAGKTPTEAFAPWTAGENAESVAELRSKLKEVNATGMKTVAMEFEFALTKAGTPVYEVRTLAGFAGEQVALLGIEGRASEGETSSRFRAPELVKGAAQPVADAARAFFAILVAGKVGAVPLAEGDTFRKIVAGLPDVDKLEQRIAEQKKELEGVLAAIKASGADGWRVRLDDVTLKATNEKGEVVGTVRAELEVREEGGLEFKLQRFRALPK